MKTISEFAKQLSDLFGSLTPAARIMSGLMVGVIVTSLGWIATSKSPSNYESLLGGVVLTNSELDRIETAFGDAQLRDYERVGRQIRIPKGEKDQYLKALSAANALPKEWGSEIDRALSEGNVFESSEKLRARLQTSGEREYANTLKRIPGIEHAAVHFDEQRKGFARQAERVCSIQLQGPQNTPIPESMMKRIAEHTSTHFAGLPVANISVLDLGTSNFYRKSDDPQAAEENPVLDAKLQWEGYLREKVTSAVSEYGTPKVVVNVKISPTLSEEQEKLQYDPTAVTLQSIESRKDSENAKTPPSGPPGADINGGLSNKPQTLSANAAGQSSKTKESQANERRVAGHDAIRKRTAGLVPTEVTVSVGVPESHYRDLWAHRYLVQNPDKKSTDEIPPWTPGDLTALKAEVETSIRAAVEGIAEGVRVGDDRKPLVEVFSFVDIPAPDLPQATLAQEAVSWFGQSWTTLALIALVLLSLGMMFSWIKTQTGSDNDRNFAEGFGLQVPEHMGDELDLSGEETDASGHARGKPEFEMSGSEMKGDLSTLIKDNPDAVVNLLKTWIGDAA